MGCGCGKSFSGSATNVVKPSNAPSNGSGVTVVKVSNTVTTGQSPPQTPVARKVV